MKTEDTRTGIVNPDHPTRIGDHVDYPLHPGDRVHWPGAPLDLGVVEKVAPYYRMWEGKRETHDLWIVWHDGHDDPVGRDGRLLDHDFGDPVIAQIATRPMFAPKE